MSTRTKLETMLGVVLTVATAAVAVVVVEQRFFPYSRRDGETRIEKLSDWEDRARNVRASINGVGGSVQVDIFTDFECPFCRRLDSVLRVFDSANPGKLALSVIHFPLPMHANARKAAIAFECAARLGHAREMSAGLFEARNLSTVDYDSLSQAKGLSNFSAFSSCIADSSRVMDKINSGFALANQLELRSTPTVVVDGALIDPATPSAVIRAIEKSLDGRSSRSPSGGRQ